MITLNQKEMLFMKELSSTKEIRKKEKSVEEYIRYLHELPEHADFADRESTIRDRLVLGLLDQELSEKLQLESELTLTKATQLARQSELVKIQIREQRGLAHSSANSEHWCTTSFLQPLPYLVTP